MGFLNNTTNNIILDAVLTDTGRQFLARNDGSFSIIKFACSDDEVNYTIIKKFGRTVGKEKIEKNTPVFEGLTLGGLAQKYRLVSVSNPNLLRLPNLSLTGTEVNSTGTLVSLGRINTKSAVLTITQTIQNETSIDVELRDQSFIVELSNLFLQIEGQTPDHIDGQNRASYIMTRDPEVTALGGSKLTFTTSVKALTDAQFTVFGQTSAGVAKNVIKTFVRVSGLQSGRVAEFAVNISKTG